MIICTQVPPVPIRPSVAMDLGGGSNEDDLTVKLQEILDVNASVKAALDNGANVKMIMENWDFLQVGEGEGGRTHLLLVLVILPLTTHPFRGTAPFPLLNKNTPNSWALITCFSCVTYSLFAYLTHSSCFAYCGHHLPPRIGR